MTWKQALTRAITAEVAAEKAATVAEEERRRTWWATTWALAAVPRAEWSEAQTEYVKRTNHSKVYCDNRRRTGSRLPQTMLAHGLPTPRFAEAAANWIGKDGDEDKVQEAVKLLADAEKNEQSLREFSLALTGRSWTNAPENLTEAEEDAVVEKVARIRPHKVAEQTQKPAVAAAVAKDAVASKAVTQERVNRVRKIQSDRKAAKAANPQAAGEMAALKDAEDLATLPSHSSDFNAVERYQAASHSRWLDAIRRKSFTEMDISAIPLVFNRLQRLSEEMESFMEAVSVGGDPYAAVAAIRQERDEQFDLENDLAEHGVDISDLDEIEQFANQGSA